jgi:SAM-dependent methyltransferase
MNYDDIANQYDEYGKEAITDWILGYDNVLKLLGEVRGKNILDFGAGAGKFSRVLKDKGAEVVGVDKSIKVLDIARENNPDIAFYQNSDDESNFFSNVFDFAVLNFVLCTIPRKRDILSALKQIWCALKPNGILILLTANVEKSRGRQFMTFAIGHIGSPTSGSPIRIYLGRNKPLVLEDYYWTEKDYKEFLSEAGFDISDILEPLAGDNSHPWEDEMKSPPFLIIKARKKTGL